MLRHSMQSIAVAAACVLFGGVLPAFAGSDQTWVAPTGADIGACTITAPCKTFQYAYSQTNAGGVLSVLSSGEFGPLIISKSISVVSEHGEGEIVGGNVFGANGASIIVNGVGIEVRLRGLVLDPIDYQHAGIWQLTGATLHVQDCKIRGGLVGIWIDGVGFGGANSDLDVSDTSIMGATVSGIEVWPTTSATVKVTLERDLVEKSIIGLSFNSIGASMNVTVRNSVISGNRDYGVAAGQSSNQGSMGSLTLLLDRVKVSGNGAGVWATQGATIRIADSTITANTTGISRSNGGMILSFGTNKINANQTDGTPNGTVGLQ